MMKDMTVICVQIIRCCHTARQTSLDIKNTNANPKDCENCPLREKSYIIKELSESSDTSCMGGISGGGNG